MSYHLKVKGLAGLHIGQHVTIKTKNTEASGVLQGFEHEGSVITELTYSGEEHHPGGATTHLTIFPNQRILATMEDEVVVHGYDKPEPVIEAPDGGWKVGDTAQYCGMINGKHVYTGGAAHQAEMNGENNGPVD